MFHARRPRESPRLAPGTLAASFPDGVWFVDLTAARDADAVTASITSTLGVDSDELRRYLRERELLLVLDPFDHLRPSAPVLSSLARAAPRVKLLVTNREPLNLYGEHRYELSPLRAGDAGGSS